MLHCFSSLYEVSAKELRDVNGKDVYHVNGYSEVSAKELRVANEWYTALSGPFEVSAKELRE